MVSVLVYISRESRPHSDRALGLRKIPGYTVHKVFVEHHGKDLKYLAKLSLGSAVLLSVPVYSLTWSQRCLFLCPESEHTPVLYSHNCLFLFRVSIKTFTVNYQLFSHPQHPPTLPLPIRVHFSHLPALTQLLQPHWPLRALLCCLSPC